jgi:hypothetical protein
MTTTSFKITKDIDGNIAFALPFTNLKYQMTLDQNVAKTITVPTGEPGIGFYRVIIVSEPGTTIWVAPTVAATVPASSTPALTSSELNPGPRDVTAGTVLSIITPNITAQVGVQIYAL